MTLTLRHKLAALVGAAAIGSGAGAGIYAAAAGSPAAAPATVVAAQPASVTSTTLTIGQIAKGASPGVVDITVSGTTGSSPFGDQQQSDGEGSGFVLDRSGHIVTNYHVIEGASTITVHFADGTTATASVVGSDASSDLAVLKVDVAASKLTPLTLGTSSSVKVGDGVVAIGSPYGEAGTVTSGIVSAVGREIQAPNGYTISGAVQTDAAINPGNSGGPLLDANGNVIGVNAQIESESGGNDGVGFAIPVDTVKSVVAQLLAGGSVEHAYLGVQVADASGGGAEVASVQSGSPAATAGLQAGDVVTAVDGDAVADASALTARIAADAAGDRVTLTVERAGATRTVTVTLGTRPAA